VCESSQSESSSQVSLIAAHWVSLVQAESGWAATTSTLLFKERYVMTAGGNPGRTYDISPDGQRFLMIKDSADGDPSVTPPSMVVVEHWTEELKRLVPTR